MLTLQFQIDLHHNGQCHLLGVAPDGTCWVEEFYDDQWAAQHIIAADGTVAHSTDEDYGRAQLVPLPFHGQHLPDPAPNPFPALDYDTQAPEHGNRAADRIDGLCYPLDVSDKMQLSDILALDVPTPTIIGLSRSRVLGVASLTDETALIARELAFPCVLLAPEPDYNYTTHTRYILQRVPPADDLLNLNGLVRAKGLRRPVGCAIAGDRLIVADAGGPDTLNRILVYSLAP